MLFKTQPETSHTYIQTKDAHLIEKLTALVNDLDLQEQKAHNALRLIITPFW